jgi:hypothetical protein
MCKNCLIQFDQLINSSKNYKFPNSTDLLIEGLHYYKENSFIVLKKCIIYLKGVVVKIIADIVYLALIKNKVNLKN